MSDELLRFATRARRAAKLRGTVSILIESDQQMQALNRTFRGKDRPTDVLSFPAAKEARHLHAGDIAISAEIAAKNAKRYGHSLPDEIKILILHGMLHLGGHDHEADAGEMEALEGKLRAKLGLADSLIDRAGKSLQKATKAVKMEARTRRPLKATTRTRTKKR